MIKNNVQILFSWWDYKKDQNEMEVGLYIEGLGNKIFTITDWTDFKFNLNGMMREGRMSPWGEYEE